MARLSDQLRARRPELDWQGRQRMRGDTPLGLGDATTALEESADLDELEQMLAQDYPGASLDDVDPELLERALGRNAVDDLDALRRIERELQEQGYLQRSGGDLTLTPRGMRRLGETALGRIFARLHARGRGDHDTRDAGCGGRPDRRDPAVAVRRRAAVRRRPHRPQRGAAQRCRDAGADRRRGLRGASRPSVAPARPSRC